MNVNVMIECLDYYCLLSILSILSLTLLLHELLFSYHLTSGPLEDVRFHVSKPTFHINYDIKFKLQF